MTASEQRHEEQALVQRLQTLVEPLDSLHETDMWEDDGLPKIAESATHRRRVLRPNAVPDI